MSTPEHRDICIKLNNVLTNDPCALCGGRCDPSVAAIFIDGTQSLVCDVCAMKRAPGLLRLIRIEEAAAEYCYEAKFPPAENSSHKSDNPLQEQSEAENPARQFEQRVTPDDYFGGCPECGRFEMLIIGRDHWCFCEEHKVRWCLGSNLFSGWRHETDQIWELNKRQLAGYRDVKPITPERKFCERCGAGTQGTHHPLCSHPDGTPTELSDKAVRHAVDLLDRRGFRVVDSTEDGVPF